MEYKGGLPMFACACKTSQLSSNKYQAQQQCLASPVWNNNNMNVSSAICCSSFQSHNIYLNSETSTLQRISKLRNAWGQQKRIFYIRKMFWE